MDIQSMMTEADALFSRKNGCHMMVQARAQVRRCAAIIEKYDDPSLRENVIRFADCMLRSMHIAVNTGFYPRSDNPVLVEAQVFVPLINRRLQELTGKVPLTSAGGSAAVVPKRDVTMAEIDRAKLKLHIVSEHANGAGLNLTDSEAEDYHEHEHRGPCGIRNHDIKWLGFDEAKIAEVLKEAEEM